MNTSYLFQNRNIDRLFRRFSPQPSEESLQQRFMNLDIDNLMSEYKNANSDSLLKEGNRLALELFHQAAERIPAYKDFLKKNNIDPNLIKTLEDFKKVPIMDKKNYLRAYPLKDLCWDGKLDNLYILSSSSGSTGEPFLWPRGEEQELEGALNFELIFKEIFHTDKLKTLYIVCFAMGTWISGPFVLACAEYLERKGYPILTVTPGLDRDVTYSLFKSLAPQFDQIIISGYPPYVKDILDDGESSGINWKKHKIKFLFAAEGFSEQWREYIHAKVGADEKLITSVNIYGSADAAILAHETPLTTAIRCMTADNPDRIYELFSENRLPTLAQYDPRLKYFEEVDGSLIFTTRSGIPLIRYSIGDHGGLYTFDEMDSKINHLSKNNLKALLQKESTADLLWKLPFVYVFGRSDFTVSLYGLLIYPEHIKYGLERKNLQKNLTGKFVMSIEYDNNNDQYLLIRVELCKGVKGSANLRKTVENEIVNGLKQVNSEYNRLLQSIKRKAIPVIDLIENDNIEYFKKGAKQKWTLR
jgi:phenylacetate-CoA ligase